MAETTIETIDELLEGVIDETEDSDVRYKLRSARQLLEVIKRRHERINEDINDAVDEDVLADLRDLGYIE